MQTSLSSEPVAKWRPPLHSTRSLAEWQVLNLPQGTHTGALCKVTPEQRFNTISPGLQRFLVALSRMLMLLTVHFDKLLATHACKVQSTWLLEVTYQLKRAALTPSKWSVSVASSRGLPLSSS